MNEIKLFDSNSIRTIWNEEEQQWYFSVVDVCNVLSESKSTDSGAYWRKLKQRLIAEGSEVVTKCHGLKMQSSDGKFYKTDALNTDGILRLVQSIPSKKAEPFKLWLAQVGRERLEEIADPGRALERVRDTYLQKGYSNEWIETRLKSIDIRNKLTDEWSQRGIENNKDYAILTAEISKAAFGMTPNEYKAFKGIDKPLVNVRDHMTDLELIFTMLSEASTKDIVIKTDARGFYENLDAAKKGGSVARVARERQEALTGTPVSSKSNYLETTESEQRKRLSDNRSSLEKPLNDTNPSKRK